MSPEYPLAASARDRWILDLRPAKNAVDPWRPVDFLLEQEPDQRGALVDVATLFLANRECPFRCLMCDLWRNTLDETVPAGAIPAQIRFALERLPSARHIKLYNAGNFFDPRAIPPADYPAIADLLSGFERVIVESHPAFIGDRCLRFQDLLAGELEVAIGLETAHPETLDRLNKRMTLADFRAAAEFLARHGVALRVFILIRPPFMTEADGLEWACRSLEFSFDCGAEVCSLIPTRAGNGSLEALQRRGEFWPPSLVSIEAALDFGVGLRRGRVFVDLWEIDRVRSCDICWPERLARMERINHTQQRAAPVPCAACRAVAS